MEKSCLVPVARVLKTHGVRGELKVLPYGETLGAMEAGEKLFLIEGGEQRQLTIFRLRSQARAWIAEFEEIGSIDEARKLAGKDLLVYKDRLPRLPADEYYHFQLVGLSVVTKEGEPLGTLSAIFQTAGHDVYVVESGGKELLIPAIEDVVCEVDLTNAKLIVDLPEGLQ
ncbi:MAG: ribosome maturation factor RimM [Syntrophobacteraceae bacterium]